MTGTDSDFHTTLRHFVQGMYIVSTNPAHFVVFNPKTNLKL